MQHLLLLGAGFSHNWKAPLTNEIGGKLRMALASDVRIIRALNDAIGCGDFELALAQLQSEYRAGPNDERKATVDRFQGALGNLFDDINVSLAKQPFHFSNSVEFSVTHFLARFDAIFNLNQDLLLELHYDPQLSPGGKSGFACPGMRLLVDPQRGPHDKHLNVWTPLPKEQFKTDKNIQPHFKLHGSSRWRADNGAGLMIVGGDKALTIQEHEILRWYHEEFRRRLSQRGTRLMVIGYGFRDRHINDLLYEAWKVSQYEMYVVDPVGLGVRNPQQRGPLRYQESMEEITAIGESRRKLSETFAGDSYEHSQLLKFFKD